MKKDLLKPGLTFEEFEHLAAHIPKRRQKTVFKLILLNTYVDQNNKINPYPKFGYAEITKGFFPNKEEAEKGFDECYNFSERRSASFLGFKILELPVNRISNFGRDGNNGAIREYLYDETGKEIERTVTSGVQEDYGTKYGIYLGKPKNQQRFKAGDLVEIMDDGKIKLGVVANNPIDTEWCYNYYLRSELSKIGYCLDVSDDQVAVIDGYGYASHSHIPLCNIMKPHYKVPEHIRKRYQKYYDYMLRESEEYKKKNSK